LGFLRIKIKSGQAEMSTVGHTRGNQQPHDGPLAEFVALRQEIDRRSTIQHNLFALQLSASAVIFSFALSQTGRSGFLLIIPVSTFMLTARYVDQMYGIQNVGWYIRHVLAPKIPGGLEWEEWIHGEGDAGATPHRSRAAQFSHTRRRAALVVSFPAIALGALVWSAPTVFWLTHRLPVDERSALIVTWILGLAATISALQMILHAIGLASSSSW
jgi:hypothetical protein